MENLVSRFSLFLEADYRHIGTVGSDYTHRGQQYGLKRR